MLMRSAEAYLICGSLASCAHVVIMRCIGQRAIKRHVQVGVAIVRCQRDLRHDKSAEIHINSFVCPLDEQMRNQKARQSISVLAQLVMSFYLYT
jgi:hypothetical protein